MANWTLTIVPSAIADLHRVRNDEESEPPETVRRQSVADITKAIRQLPENPHPRGAEEIEGTDSMYRLAVGSHFVEYQLVEAERKVRILLVE
ncbi:type II toxin-antitoxin system RelE/ParE family toxin [Chloroflexi bacterium TSY]|nr:type II toxin-antitoxin system RelE/ParE family toxin [Chloroflexi bacterium TSY]